MYKLNLFFCACKKGSHIFDHADTFQLERESLFFVYVIDLC